MSMDPQGTMPSGNAVTEKMRVLVLATRVPLRSGDGTPSFILDNLVSLTHECEIVVLAPRIAESGRWTAQDGLTVRRFAYFPRRWESLADDAIMPQIGRAPWLWLQAASMTVAMLLVSFREHRRFRPDLVHAQWIVPSGLIAAILRLILRTPYVLTSQGADAHLLNSWPILPLKRIAVRNASRFIGVSHAIVAQFADIAQSPIVQPSGIDFSWWEQHVGERSPERGRVLFVGRLAEKKGVEVALRALCRAPTASLRIVGDGPLMDGLKRTAERLAVGGRVTFLGRQTREQIATEFRHAMCVVIPSVEAGDGDREGTPNVLGEAVASGVPVVASDIDGLGELLVDRSTGMLCEPGDAAAFASAIVALAADPVMAIVLADSARAALRPLLDIDEVAVRTMDLYRLALSTP